MRFEDIANPKALRAYLPTFLSIVGADGWKRRTAQLASEFERSPFLAKIVSDYHWLELSLSIEIMIQEAGASDTEPVEISGLAGLHFAQAIVEVHRNLTPRGKGVLEGRLRDGLKAETGLAPLFFEMELTNILNSQNYDIEFPDLEGSGQYDIRFRKADVVGEIECKSLSADSGRKIHRKAFYRVLDRVRLHIFERIKKGPPSELLLVTLPDRLVTDITDQRSLIQGLEEMLTKTATRLERDNFLITRETFSPAFSFTKYRSQRELYRAFQDAFGETCHVAGAASDGVECLIAMRSSLGDDHSKPQVEAMKKAASQFSGKLPGFVAIQYNDIDPADLLLPHLRERAAILSTALFLDEECKHIAATYFGAFAGAQLTADRKGVGHPGFACWNPNFAMSPSGLPFQVGPTDAEFAKMFGR